MLEIDFTARGTTMATAVSAPTITSVVFDKTGYNAGDTIHATVTYVPGKSESAGSPVTYSVEGTGTDVVTGQTGQLAGTFTVTPVAVPVNDATTLVFTDSGSRTWTKVSDTGTVAVFTATA